ncbi:haloacid dehalogenase [Actinoplanes sp. OR16]|uniref:HAD family hydrolase n=1 Tax=Actinoplanes sp. OR16 TaxID=946334 RepID=UPI000F6B67DE|nr:HAD family phosphatase [Actinoplanes sp. OR16]BBH68193.1 haloacid dehalogenase [Actinoplanes sp. OR16]
MPFDAVLFDCDGVLVDSERITNAVLRSMLQDLGWQISEEEGFRRFVGRALTDEVGVIEEHTGFAVTSEWIAEFRRRRDEALAVSLQPIPGAIDAARQIAKLYEGRVAVASGADRRKIELQLTKVGLDDVFAGQIYSGMETAYSKPAPDVYLAAAAGLGIDPARAVVVEDTPTGVRAGVAAGATVLGYCPPDSFAHHEPAVLLRAGATRTFSDMALLGAEIQSL